MSSNAETEGTGSSKQFSVNWNNHMNHVRVVFDSLLENHEMVDVTLYCEGQKTGAHKILLSACSRYFREIFRENPCQHPVIILKGVEFRVLQDILKFMYNGEVSVDCESFDTFLKTAQFLEISGLTETSNALSESLTQELEAKSESIGTVRTNNNNQHVVYTDNLLPGKQRVMNYPKIKKPPLKRRKSSTEYDVHPIGDANIKCEPGNDAIIYEEEPDLEEDPLEESLEDMEGDAESDIKNYVYMPDNMQGQDYKGVTKFESVYITSMDPMATPIRQSAFSESSLKCTVCQKVFSHPYSLHHHKAVHSGSTECPICHAVLSRKYNLKIHMKARHNV